MLSDYAFYKKLIHDSSKIDSDLSHFPVAIPLGASVGLTDADVTDIFDEVGADYLKIAVFMADQSTELFVEVEQWDATNEKGLLWVSRDTWTIASASNTEIYLAFSSAAADNTAFVGTPGNRAEVWNSDFVAVYTMAQDPTGGPGCIIDSTGNGNHGTPHGSMTSGALVDGQIGKAIDFDGSDDFVDLGFKPNGQPECTLLVNAKVKSNPEHSTLIGTANSDFNDIVITRTSGGSDLSIRSQFRRSDSSPSNVDIPESYLSLEEWFFSRATFNAGDIAQYHNGVITESAIGGTTVLSSAGTFSHNIRLCWAAIRSTTYSDCTIGFAAVAWTEISEAWIKADYHAQTDNLLTFEATQSAGSTTALEDISLDLSAYHQARSDLAAMLAASYGTVLQDLTTALKTYGQSVDDLPAALAAYFQDRQDLAAHLTTWAAGRQDLQAVLRAMGLGRDNLPAHLQTVAWSGRDLATVLAAVTPLVFRDLGLTLTATDGTVMENLATVLSAVKRAPQYRSVVAQRIRSVISEVS